MTKMAEELKELQEHAEESIHFPSMKPVTLTMALLAVFVAIVSLLGHRTHTEELLLQNKATNQWSYFQAKSIRRHSYEMFLEQLETFPLNSQEKAVELKEKYSQKIALYTSEQRKIEAEARTLEKEIEQQRHKANHFDLGEVLLESALVITSITLLTHWLLFWYLGLLLGCCGLFAAASGFFVG